MATNLKIDEALVEKALKIGGLKTKKETVKQALAEFVQHRQQREVLDLAGTIDFWPDYDPKKHRARGR